MYESITVSNRRPTKKLLKIINVGTLVNNSKLLQINKALINVKKNNPVTNTNRMYLKVWEI